MAGEEPRSPPGALRGVEPRSPPAAREPRSPPGIGRKRSNSAPIPEKWNLCVLCGQDKKACNGTLGALLGPLDDGNRNGVGVYIHRYCALWSSEVYHNSDATTLRNVGKAIRRGRQIRCGHCGERGATLGCRNERCNVSYHLHCARAVGCAFNISRYLIACPRHAKDYKHEEEEARRGLPGLPESVRRRALGLPGPGPARDRDRGHGAHRDHGAGPAPRWAPDSPPARRLGLDGPGGGSGGASPARREEGGMESPAAKRRKLDPGAVAKHLLLARAALDSARAEAAAAAAAAAAAEADDDEAVFAAKERRRTAKDTARLAPVMLGGGAAAAAPAAVAAGAAAGAAGAGGAGGGAAAPTAPGGVYSRGFESVGGAQEAVAALREMVLLPLLHPGLMERLGVEGAAPPRGILLHGLPGTGKTLAVRALAGEVGRRSPVPVALFARGGADVLGKYHGDAERTLRLLFEEARRRAPSIIFLDELDALAPSRSQAGTGGCDQIYASVVATLLALMDGMADRGQVVVIGATNRPDNLDPALRRPGRFDREVAFGLPGPADREAILRVHTRAWSPPPPPQLLRALAAQTEGFAGADLEALSSSAVLAAVRRSLRGGAPGPGASLGAPPSALRPSGSGGAGAGAGVGASGVAEIAGGGSSGGACPSLEELVQRRLRAKAEAEQRRRQRAEDRERRAQQRRLRRQLKAAAAEAAAKVEAERLKEAAAAEAAAARAAAKEAAAEAVAKAAEAKAAAKAAARAEREAEAREAEAREANADAEMEDVGAEPGGETGAQEAAATTAGAEEAEAGGPEHIAPTAGPSAIRQGVDTSPTPAHSPNTAPDEVAGPGPGPGPQVTPRPADGAGGMLHDGSGGDDGSGGVGGAAAGPSGEAARPARAGFASVFRGFGAMFDLAADSPALRQPRAAARQEQPQQEQRQQEEPAPERQPAPGQEPPRDADQELDLGRDPGRAVEAGEEEGPGPQAMEVEAVPAAGVAAELGPGSVGPDAGAEAAIVPGPHASGRTGDAGAGAAAAAARPGVPAEPAAPAEGQGAASAETTAPAEGQGAERGGDEDRAQARDAPAEAEAEASSDEDDEEGEDEGREEEADAHLDDWLSGVHVTALDWDAALAAAPKPCSRREAMAAVCPGLPPPPPAHVAALTAPSAAAAVRCLAAAGLAVPPVVADAAAAMAADPTPVPTTGMAAAAGAAALQEATAAALGRLVSALAEFGAVEPVNSASASSSNSPDDLAPAAGNGAGPVATDPVAVPWVLAAGASRLVAPAPAPPVHLLLCGAGDAGQDATASTVLRLLNSSPSPSQPLPKPHSGAANAAPFCQPCPARPVSLHTINIAAIILRGGAAGGGGGLGSGGGASDAAEGVAALVSEALAAAPRGALLVLHLPRIDTWALEQRLGSGRAARLLGGRATAGSQPSSGAAAHGGAGGGSERGRGQVKAGEAGEDEDWDLGSPLAPGWSGGVGGGGGGGRGFDALLEAGAPSSPAHDGSSGSGKGSESEGEGGGGGGSSSDGEDEDDDGDWGGGSDLPSSTGITPAWSLFAQQATAVAAALAGAGGGGTGGRLVVVATCAQPLASLPAEVREFFGAPPTPSAAPAAAQPTSAEAEGDEGEESDGAVPAAALALYRSLMGSGPEAGGPAAVATAATAAVAPREPAAAPPGTSCRHALELAPPSAVALAAAAAAAEAGLLPLLRTAVAEAAITVLLSAATAAGCNGALGPSADAAEPAAPPGGQPPPPLPPPPAGPASRAEEDAEAAGRVGVNAAELERGRKMLLQAQHVIRSLGATMLRRKTGCLLARATVRGGARADGAGGGGEGTPGGGGGSAKDKDKRRRDGVVTLAAVAQRAVEGRIHTLDELMREVASTAALIRSIRSSAATAAASPPPSLPAAANAAASAADLAPSSSRGGVGYSRAAAAASHWEDYVAATLEAASRALGLQDPGNRRLMAAALEAYRGKGAGSGRSAGAGGGGAVGAGGAGAGGGAAGGGERLGTGSPARRTPVRAATRRLLAGSGAGAVTPAAAVGERPAEPHGTGSELASGGGGGSTGVGGAAPPAEQHRLALEVGTGGGGTRVGGGGGEQRLGGGAVLSRAVLQAAAEALAEGVVARLEATGAVRRALDCSWFSAGAGRRGPGVEEVAERVGALGRRLVEACGEAAEQAMGAAATGVGGGGSDGGGGGQQSALWGWALQVVEIARGQGGEEGEAMAGAGGSGGALAQAEGGQAAEVAGAVECLASCLEGALGLPSRGAAGA